MTIRFSKYKEFYSLALVTTFAILAGLLLPNAKRQNANHSQSAVQELNQPADHNQDQQQPVRDLPLSRAETEVQAFPSVDIGSPIETHARPAFSAPHSSGSRRLFERTEVELAPVSPLGEPESEQVLSRSAIRVDWNALGEIREQGSGTLVIETGKQKPLAATVEKVTGNLGNGYSLSGQLDGYPGSSFVATVHGDALVASFREGNGTGSEFEIVVNHAGQQEVREVDNHSSIPVCSVGQPHGAAPEAKKGSSLVKTKSALPTGKAEMIGEVAVIDVMVVYTATARQVAGGTNGILASINHIVENANLYFIASGVSAIYRLVHTEEIDFDDSMGYTSQQHLSDLGWELGIPGVHALRDTHGADIVTLLTGRDYGGRAYRMETVSGDFEDNAFNVVGASYTRTLFKWNYLFSHECAHNLGCDHDWLFSDGDNRPYTYNYGHRWPGGPKGRDYITLMSNTYEGSIVYQFSNPDLNHKGVPTGTDTADNAQAINNTKTTVSGFRNSVSTLPVLQLTSNRRSASPSSRAYEVQVIASEDWTWEKTGGSWLRISEESPQSGPQRFRYSMSRNSGRTRKATITFRSGESSVTHTVSQSSDGPTKRKIKKVKKQLKSAKRLGQVAKIKRYKKLLKKLKIKLRKL